MSTKAAKKAAAQQALAQHQAQQQATITTATASTSSSSTSAATTTTAHHAQQHTPGLGGGTQQHGRPSSPLSPTRLTRIQEKHELQNLNDRLATYIDRVRHLEQENSKLVRQVNTSQEVRQKEVTTIRSMYDKEIHDTRRSLDDASKEKARLQMECNKLRTENEDLKGRLDRKTRDLNAAEKQLAHLESQVSDLTTKYNMSASERSKAISERKDIQAELDKTRKTLEAVQKEMEAETMARVEIENKAQGLREELSFKDQVHQQQMTETRTKKQIEITEIDGRLHEEYEAKMQKSLQELRDQYEAQLGANRGEVEKMFEAKLVDLRAQVQRYSNVASTSGEDLRQARSRVESLSARVSELEGLQGGYLSRIRDLEKTVDADRARFTDILADKESELQRLRDQMAAQLQEYQDLMDIKVALDMEIAAYRKLLEGEEARLNITPSRMSGGNQQKGATPARRTPMRGTKRKRAILDETEELSHSDFTTTSSSLGEIEVSEVCPEGKFVKLHNKGEKEVTLGGWQVVRKVGEEETSYKFHRTVKVEGKGQVCVWSSDTGVQHEPPSNLVMKGQRWFVGDTMTTTLFNNQGDEVAVQECRRKQLSQSTLHHRDLGGFGASYPVVEVGNEDMFHQQGDPRARENCSIM